MNWCRACKFLSASWVGQSDCGRPNCSAKTFIDCNVLLDCPRHNCSIHCRFKSRLSWSLNLSDGSLLVVGQTRRFRCHQSRIKLAFGYWVWARCLQLSQHKLRPSMTKWNGKPDRRQRKCRLDLSLINPSQPRSDWPTIHLFSQPTSVSAADSLMHSQSTGFWKPNQQLSLPTADDG